MMSYAPFGDLQTLVGTPAETAANQAHLATLGTLMGQQAALKFAGFKGSNGLPLDLDGLPGPNTTFAIRSFQTSRAIGVDGIVGPDTQAALFASGLPDTMTPAQKAAAMVDGGVDSARASRIAGLDAQAPDASVIELDKPGSATIPTVVVVGNVADALDTVSGQQMALNTTGFVGQDGKVLSVDNQKGPNTIFATKAFQTSQNIQVDGDFGTQTKTAMRAALASGFHSGAPGASPIVLTLPSPSPKTTPNGTPVQPASSTTPGSSSSPLASLKAAIAKVPKPVLIGGGVLGLVFVGVMLMPSKKKKSRA